MESKSQKLTGAWRVAMLAALCWIAVELHLIRQEMPTRWDFTGYLSSIESTSIKIQDLAEKILRFMPTR